MRLYDATLRCNNHRVVHVFGSWLSVHVVGYVYTLQYGFNEALQEVDPRCTSHLCPLHCPLSSRDVDYSFSQSGQPGL